MLSLLATIIFVVSCYSDKGNYDYNDIQKIDFQIDSRAFSGSINDTINVDFTLSQNIDETSPNHTFEWTLNGKTRPEWNKKKFSWIVDEFLIKAKLELKITDKRNGVIYADRVDVSVVGLYEEYYSWMILSDVAGESRLSYMSTLETESIEGSNEIHIKKARFDEDVYGAENGGESLGQGPISLQEHFREVDGADQQFGQVTVFQQSGAVDLKGENFVKDIDMSRTFVGGVYPNGVVLHPGTYMELVDLVTDQNGKVYSRLKSFSTLFHSEYFLHKPRRVDGETEELSKCKIIRGFYATNRFGYAVIYDGNNKRLLTVTDGKHDWESDLLDAGKIEPIFKILDTVKTANTIPLSDMSGYELLYMKQGGTGKTYHYNYNMVLRNENTNELFLQYFVAAFGGYSPPAYINTLTCTKILGLPSTPTCIAFPIYSKQEYGFFAIGNTVYMLDLLAMDRPAVPYYVFDSNITAMSCDSNRNNAHLAVGLENGGFHVLGIAEAKNTSEEHKLLYSAPKKVGKIVDIQCKSVRMFNW